MFDPEVPADVSAKALLEVEASEPVPAGLAWAIAQRASPARAREVAEAAAALDPDSLTTAELAAQVAELEDDFGRAAEIREEALSHSDHPRMRFHLAHAYMELHRMADALEMLEPLARDEPENEFVGGIYADALIEADRHLPELGSRRPCPCGSGKRYGPCCRQREQRAVERFNDPSPLYELRDALKEYSDRPESAEAVRVGVEEWFAMGRQAEADIVPTEIDEGELRLLVERTWYLAPVSAPTSGSSPRTILELFAEDPASPPALAGRARDWADSARYGLWQVTAVEAGPGSRVTDILTGARLFVSIPPEMRRGLPRWTVILGAMIPVDGVWRTGAATLRMGPRDGEDMANEILAFVNDFARNAGRAGRGGSAVRRGTSKPKGRAQLPRIPDSWQVEPGTPTAALTDLREERASPEVAAFLSRATATLLPSFHAELADREARPVTVTNTDADPLMLVTARVEVEDPHGVRARLLAQPDFEPLHDERAVAWLGREMTSTERETALAEAQAFAARQGTELVEESNAQRFSRGRLEFDDGGITAEVNSVERLDRLVAILRKAGASPRVLSKDVIDPARGRPGGSDSRLSPSGRADEVAGGGSPEAARAWQRAWVDEQIPAMGGLTPREAAADLDSRPLLESLLRDLEWRWENARARGSAVPDIQAIRAELGMEDWTAPYFEDEPEEAATSPEAAPGGGKTTGSLRSTRPTWQPKPVIGRGKRHR